MLGGANQDGQLGDGTTTNRTTPVTVTGITGATAIAAGYSHTCAIIAGGAVTCWGRNQYGQLGDGTTTNRTAPVTVIGLTGATALTAGGAHTCAIATGGAAKCWGINQPDNFWRGGQLGDGTFDDSSVPVAVFGLSSGVSKLSAGGDHTCAVTTTGAAYCWGVPWWMLYSANPPVPEALSAWGPQMVSLSTNGRLMCALTKNGAAQCWGQYLLGNSGDHAYRHTPTTVVGLESGVAFIRVSLEGLYDLAWACALGTDGAVRCWGGNGRGELGDGTTTHRPTPVRVTGLTGVTALGLGGHHACAIVAGGAVKCWGHNNGGQLGDGSTTDRAAPVTVTGL